MKKTSRGFAYTEFIDRYGCQCSIQKSSLATEDAIWFGIDKPEVKVFNPGTGWGNVKMPKGDIIIDSRMHLTKKMIKKILPILEKFVKTGEIE
jgi:hypothetical protein